MNNIKIIHRETLSDQKYRLEKITFIKPGNGAGKHEQVNEVYFRPDAVAVLLVDPQQQQFIFTSQVRLPVFLNPNGDEHGILMEACAGLIDQGESPEQAAIREVMEETGYQIAELNKIGAVFSSAGALPEYLHLFTAQISEAQKTGNGGGAEGEGEDISLIGLSFDEARAMLIEGAINDAKTMILLQHFFLHSNK